MKRTFRLLGLSALVLGLAVACNNNQPVDAVADSLEEAIDEAIEDVTIDSALVAEQEVEAEQPVVDKKKTTTTKKNNGTTIKKADVDPAAGVTTTKVEEPKDAVVNANATTKENELDKRATKAQQKMRR